MLFMCASASSLTSCYVLLNVLYRNRSVWFFWCAMENKKQHKGNINVLAPGLFFFYFFEYESDPSEISIGLSLFMSGTNKNEYYLYGALAM